MVDKVVNAVKRAQGLAPDILFDGELQADAALVPEIAARKIKNSSVAGTANVLISLVSTETSIILALSGISGEIIVSPPRSLLLLFRLSFLHTRFFLNCVRNLC
jgi:hypothetical protein